MSIAHPRRTERIKLRRSVQLVFRSPHGCVDCIPAATFAVNCHGVGLYAQQPYSLGSEVFVLDSGSGVGAWGKLVWEGEKFRDGRVPVGVEFNEPGNHWKTRMVPPSWLPFLAERGASPLPYMHSGGKKTASAERGAVEPKSRRATKPGVPCRCCGCKEEVAVEAQEPVCKVCREWVA
jgi:hypothetical protein